MDFVDPFGRTHLSPIRLPLTAIFTHPTSPPSTYPTPPNVKRWSEALCRGKGLDYASSTAARAGVGRRHPRTRFSGSQSWRRYRIKGTMGAIDGGAVVGERGVAGGRGRGMGGRKNDAPVRSTTRRFIGERGGHTLSRESVTLGR